MMSGKLFAAIPMTVDARSIEIITLKQTMIPVRTCVRLYVTIGFINLRSILANHGARSSGLLDGSGRARESRGGPVRRPA